MMCQMYDLTTTFTLLTLVGEDAVKPVSQYNARGKLHSHFVNEFVVV